MSLTNLHVNFDYANYAVKIFTCYLHVHFFPKLQFYRFPPLFQKRTFLDCAYTSIIVYVSNNNNNNNNNNNIINNNNHNNFEHGG